MATSKNHRRSVSPPAELATAVADLTDSLRDVAIDLAWIVALVVWSAAAFVDRWSPRLAARLDRLATDIEAIADGDTEGDL